MKAFILVDLQIDFLPGGALPVKEGDQIIPIVNRILQYPFELTVASKDWHPIDHQSFAINHSKQPGDIVVLNGMEQILWPIHCVQGTHGADFAPGLDPSKIKKVFHKGIDKNIDSYSTFFDNGHQRATGLHHYLHQHHITDVYIAGLATDYCVLYSVKDACHLGFHTYVIADACRGVNLRPEDSARAFQEMEQAGAQIISSQSLWT